MKRIIILLLILLIPLASSQFGYNNPKLPNLNSDSSLIKYFTNLLDTPSTYSGSANLCVKVNPTATALEFGVCSNTTNAITSVTSGDNYIYVNPTTGNVVVFLNGTELNNTISQLAGSGISSSTANATYLKLDATNDPLTSDLTINGGSDINLELNSTTNRAVRFMSSSFDDFRIFVTGGIYSLQVSDEDGASWDFVSLVTSSVYQFVVPTLHNGARFKSVSFGRTNISGADVIEADRFNATQLCLNEGNNCIDDWSAVNSSVSAGNSSWNQTLADTLYAGIEWDYNQTSSSIYYYNQTDTIFFYNQTQSPFFYNMTQSPFFYNMSDGAGGNSSWNQTFADTLYAGIEWDYNQTPLAGSNISVQGTTVSVDTTSLQDWLDNIYLKIVDFITPNIFDQDLNTTSNVTFDNIFVTNTTNTTNLVIRGVTSCNGLTTTADGEVGCVALVPIENTTMRANSTDMTYTADKAVTHNISMAGLVSGRIVSIHAQGYLNDALGGATEAAWAINIKNDSGAIIGKGGCVVHTISDFSQYPPTCYAQATDDNPFVNATYYVHLDEVNDGMSFVMSDMQVQVFIK